MSMKAKSPRECRERAGRRAGKYVALERSGVPSRYLIEQRRREQIDSGAHRTAAVKSGIFLDETADTTGLVQFDAAIAASIVHLGAKQCRFSFSASMVFDEFAKVSISKTVAVHDQNRIGTQTLARKADSASRPERPRLNDCVNDESSWRDLFDSRNQSQPEPDDQDQARSRAAPNCRSQSSR